jgi:ATP-dependent exoDNAse (exonuclease V) beta subunit
MMRDGIGQAELLHKDEQNRLRAIEAGSFIVEAPAGAGKTELLTQRYLKLLALVNEPEEIVAITFTNKAAAEMRSRILTSLQHAADNVPIDKPHKKLTRDLALKALLRSNEQGWDLLAQPARLRINTIDSLSSLLARQMPLMSRFGAQPAVVEDASLLYQEAAARALASLESEADGGPISSVLAYFDNDAVRLQNQLALMLARRDQWLTQAGQPAVEDEAAAALRHLIQHDMQQAANILPIDIQQRLMPVARYAASNLPCEHCISLLLDWETPLLPRHESLTVWLSVCELLLTGKDEFRKRLDKNMGLPVTDEAKPHKESLLEIIAVLSDCVPLAKLRKLPDLSNIDEERRIVGALAGVLKLAAAHLVAVFQESAEVDFVEVSQRALFALVDQTGPTDLALKLDYTIRHLLVDEFQDTSPTQVMLLEKLMSGWEPDDGRTIFCVGDPMQSIYKFRKANVGQFLQAAKTGIGHLPLESLHLTRNNRSCPAVIEWVNTAFAHVFPPHDSVTRGAISYREFAATRDSLPGEGVAVHSIVAAQYTDGDTLAMLEARELADIIEREWAEDRTRSIAVLVRARNHLHALVAEIRRNRPHLPFQAVEVEGLADRQSVQDVLSLTCALMHRADRVHWLAILRAPWCGLILDDLHRLAADDHYSTIWQLMQDDARIATLSEDGQQRLLHVRTIFVEALAQQGRQSVRRWVESTWLKLGGPHCLWDTGDVRDVQALLDLIDKLEGSGRFDVATLNESVAKLYAAPDVNADGCLQFMTIHKAKGLEFDTVILPGLHRQSANGDTPLVLWEEVSIEDAPAQLVAAPWCPRHLRNDKPSTYDFLHDLECERTANETARVLYVAATRAVRRLHLMGAVKLNRDGEVKAPSGTFLELLWQNVGGEFMRATEEFQPPEVLPSAIQARADETVFLPKLIRLATPAVPEILRRDASSMGIYDDNTTFNELIENQTGEGLADRLDASIGTLAHRYMELMARDGLEAWPSSRIETLTPVMRRWLVAQGHNDDEAKRGASHVIAALGATLNSERGRWLLQHRADSDYELPVARADNLLVSTNIIDRTFVEDGTRWVIDYKSVRFTADTPEPVLLRQAERYRPQLDRYAALFENDGLTIRKAIFFLAMGRLVELV